MDFIKMHATGNDYVYIDARITPVDDPVALAQRLSHRHKGIGSDGLVLMLPSNSAHVRMRMYNADGSEAQMCGNAIRCVGKYAYEHGLVREALLKVETLAGIKTLQLHVEEGLVQHVTVDMGIPEWQPHLIPVLHQGQDCLYLPLEVLGRRVVATCLSMGNPHAVIVAPDHGLSLGCLPMEDLGPVLEHHPLFPQRINVEFIEVLDRQQLRMRVWERGAGETQACGTGACAAVCAAARMGLTERSVTVHLLGGALDIQWREDDHVFMTGEAVTVFEGRFLG